MGLGSILEVEKGKTGFRWAKGGREFLAIFAVGEIGFGLCFSL